MFTDSIVKYKANLIFNLISANTPLQMIIFYTVVTNLNIFTDSIVKYKANLNNDYCSW